VVACLVALSAAFSLVLLWPQHGTTLNWDEVDYVNAARLGVAANLLETGSLSAPDYLQFARAKIAHDEPRLPPGYDEPNDPIHLRHGHSPGVIVAMTATADARTEHSQRAIQAVGAVVLTIVVVGSYLFLSRAWTWPGLIAILLVLPWYDWHLFRSIQFHGWETIWLVVSAVLLTVWLRSGRPARVGVALCLTLAMAILTLESGAVVLLGALVCVVVWGRGLGRRTDVHWIRLYAIPGLALVGLATFVVWPGSVLRVSLLKIPLERVYQLFLGEGEVFFVKESPDRSLYLVLFLVIVPTLAYLLVRRRGDSISWGPLAVMGLLYGVVLFKFSVSASYYLPALAPFLVLMGTVLDDIGRRAQLVAGVVLVAVMAVAVTSATGVNSDDRQADRQRRADYAFVRTYVGESEAMMDGGHLFRHYAPDADISDLSYNDKELLVREAGKYVPVPFERLRGKVVGVLATRTAFLGSAAARDLAARCPQTTRETVVLWDCRRS
jgi:hypothetical protein